MIDRGQGERCSLRVVGMSASAYRYQAQSDRNVALPRRIVERAQRHKRYGMGMIHLVLLQEGGGPVSDKRMERVYREERLQVRRRKRKKVQVSERQCWTAWLPTLYRPATQSGASAWDREGGASMVRIFGGLALDKWLTLRSYIGNAVRIDVVRTTAHHIRTS